MKKLLILLLSLTLLLSMTACAKKAADTPSVYYLNFKPEADSAMQELAKLYTEEKGIPVKVVTAASGTYSDTLTAEMAKSEPPTIFNIGNMSGLRDWDEYALDLKDTAVAKALTTNDFNLYNDSGALKAIGTCYESFGLIVNTELLARAGYNLTEIRNFETLKAVADDIHSRAEELGFDAFSAPGLDSSSSWRFSGHLANLPLFYEFRDRGITEQPAAITGEYMQYLRNIWDLYITDTATDPRSLATSTGDESKGQFTEGQAVFYQNGSWEYESLSQTMKGLAMIPIYCGVPGEENAGLCSGTENCWAVNAKASQEDIQASLDYLNWLVSDPIASRRMVNALGVLPYESAPASENAFLAAGNDLLSKGNYTLTWAFSHTPNVDSWRATVVTALTVYSADPTDANWQKVVEAFVEGWAYEYKMENG